MLTLVEGAHFSNRKLRAQGEVSSSQCEVAGGEQSSARNILEEAEVVLSEHAVNIHTRVNQSFVISMGLRHWGS